MPDTSAPLTGAEIVVRCLAEEGVGHVFGYPGGAVPDILDAILGKGRVRHIRVRHEQAAVHAADAYSRSSGRAGVVLVTSGPGLANAVTGIATACMDSIPLVVVCCRATGLANGQDASHECGTAGIARPIVKHSFLVKDVRELAATLKKAFYIARTARSGPVLVEIPGEITIQSTRFASPREIDVGSYLPAGRGNAGEIRKAMQLILEARRPLVLAGGGVILANAAAQLNEFVDRLRLPCTATLTGLGGYRASGECFLGMAGMHGTHESNMALHRCDVLIAVGTRFDERTIGSSGHFGGQPRRIIHVDVDRFPVSRRFRVDIPVVGNARDVLEEMLAQLDASGGAQPDSAALADWWHEIGQWRATHCLAYAHSDEVIKPQAVIEKLWEVTQGDAFVTAEAGQHQAWVAQYYRFDKPRRWVGSAGLGTMGVGLPYAIGVQVANPGATVACVTGEGPIQMNIQELATCKQYHLAPKVILLNDRYPGTAPDFVMLAQAYGHVGMKVARPGDVEGALREAFAMQDRLVFMDFVTDPTETSGQPAYTKVQRFISKTT